MFPMDRHGWESFMAARAKTRADLSEAVYQEVGLSRRESAELVGSAGAGVKQKQSRENRTLLTECPKLGVEQTYLGHAPNVAS